MECIDCYGNCCSGDIICCYGNINLLCHFLQEIHKVLADHNWNVADATVTLSSSTSSLKAITSENKVRAKAASHMKKHQGYTFSLKD
ncbi:hypothetical protein DPMN_061515 [Dreissena polymorpha]|uniref:Uncharacterized protein n=1 Tax=Dreissena polymorpha TaxID=45954 RepID=A0A9D4C839_DREPO|nr:hypothetical protein DPMN_061515 [Dreissena polymorpha]